MAKGRRGFGVERCCEMLNLISLLVAERTGVDEEVI
jgi:hypothetical protein